MKIVFVNDTFLVGELARKLGKKHEVYVIGSSDNFREENFTFIKASIEGFKKEGNIRDFFLLLKIKKSKEFYLRSSFSHCWMQESYKKPRGCKNKINATRIKFVVR